MGIPGKLSRAAVRRNRMEIRRFKIVSNGITVVSGPSIGKRSKVCKASATPVITCYVKPGCMNGIDRQRNNICNSSNSRVFTSSDDHGKISGNAYGGEEEETQEENGQFGYGRACPPHGAVSVCGKRREMEDALTVVPGIVDLPDAAGVRRTLHFFAVYDGHGGPQAAVLCKDRLHQLLKTELDNFAAADGRFCGFGDEAQWQKIMAGCFLRMDAEIGAGCDLNKNLSNAVAGTIPETAGSTAVVAVVSSDQIVVANCGDSRAVLSRGGTAVALSVDHKPDRADEMARIESSGGKVILWNGPRVLGVLATSRSLGDRYLKPYVTAEPEVTCSRRTRDDECLILASDGLWDVLSNEMACEIARKCLEAGGRMRKYFCCDETPAAMAAALLTKLAIARGSCDNITVVVVDLTNAR